MEKLSLEGIWKLRGEFLDITRENFMEVLEREEGEFGIEFSDKGLKPFPYRKGFMDAQVPGDVTSALIQNGIVEEPLLKTNTKESIWVKDLSWWFIKDFTISENLLANEEVRLFIEVLDYKADIIINGHMVAEHKNSFVPFYEDVKQYLRIGNNKIIIRLTSGIEDNYERDSISFYCMSTEAICDQRIYLRKPQYTYGWDWCKPVPTCGIGRSIYLEGISEAKISAFRADTTELRGTEATLDLFFEIEKINVSKSEEGTLHYRILKDSEEVYRNSQELYLVGGLNFHHEQVIIKNAKLWWPNGYGEQNIYTVEASFSCNHIVNDMDPKKIGVRTIKVSHDKRVDGSREYQFIVNGVNVWCKGGNWVPADSLYLRVNKSKYKALVEEAKEANFTMLRIWGGGTYEPDYFYDFCSENGILIMHDFMYACAFYPDHLDWFLHQAYLEAEYQTKRLAHYPCMAVWTGNNEIHESYKEWFPERIAPKKFYGARIFNYIQPKAVKDNAPYLTYAPSSPYYGDLPNNQDSGDSHIWKWMRTAPETKMHYNYELEAFDRLKVSFSSEYGFFGAQMHSTVEQYHNGEGIEIGSEIWIHHGEQERKRNAIDGGIRRHLCAKEEFSVKEYLLYSGVLQGCLYQDMALTLRSKSCCSGNLIWMYNDCWPETGWSIIDYYLTRKISFYYLKRAFAANRFIVKVADGKVYFTLINETPKAYDLEIEYGFMLFDGEKKHYETETIHLEQHSVIMFEKEEKDNNHKSGFYYIKSRNEHEYFPVTAVRPYFRELLLLESSVEIVLVNKIGEHMEITIISDTYIPVVYLSLKDDRIKYSDNYFELLPKTAKTVLIYDCDTIPEIHKLDII